MTDSQRRPPPKSRRQLPVDDEFDVDATDDLADDADEYYQGADIPIVDGGAAPVHHVHHAGGHHAGGHHG